MSSYLADSNQYATEHDNCPVFLERYLEYLQTNLRKRPLTVVEAMLVLREFCQYIHYRNTNEDISPSGNEHKRIDIVEMKPSELSRLKQCDLEEYLFFLEEVSNNSTSTVRKKVSILRHFYNYLMQIQMELSIGFPFGDPTLALRLPSPSEEQSDPVTLTVPQLYRLVSGVSGNNALRDMAILLLFVTTGISLSELVELNWSDFDPHSEWLRIRGKNEVRYVYLTEVCRSKISDYLEIFRHEPPQKGKSAPLFSSSKLDHKRLSTRRVRNLIVKIGAVAGLGDDISPKTLRDTAASIMMQYAGESGELQVLDYLGYHGDTCLRNRFAPAHHNRRKGNIFMKQIVESSPLAELGARREIT